MCSAICSGAAEVLRDVPADVVADLRQLRIDDSTSAGSSGTASPAAPEPAGRGGGGVIRCGGAAAAAAARPLLLGPRLGFGLRPHLGHAAQKFFDFVFHGSSGSAGAVKDYCYLLSC